MSNSVISRNRAISTKLLASNKADIPMAVFIISGTHSAREIKESVASVNNLNHGIVRVYLIDNSMTGRYGMIAKSLMVRYVHAPYNDTVIHKKITGLKANIHAVILTPGEAVEENTMPHLSLETNSAAIAVDDSKNENAFSKIKATTASFLSMSGQYAKTASSAVRSTKEKMPTKSQASDFYKSLNTSVAANKRPVLYTGSLILLILTPLAFFFFSSSSSDNQDQASSQMSIAADVSDNAATNNTKKQSNTADETSSNSSNPNIVNPDEGQPQTASFTIEAGDSMSSIITEYVNDMHASFPQLSLARLGYAQDKLMNIYGYEPLPRGQETFVVSAKDVQSAWDTADRADSWEAFWSDYAKRAGIKW